MHLVGSSILACVNLVGWLLISVVLWAHRQTIFADEMWSGGPGVCVFVLFAVWLLFCLAVMLSYMDRVGRLIRCRGNPEYVAALLLDLKGANVRQRLLALETLADHCGQPSGSAMFWPFGGWNGWQFKTVRTLLKKRARAEAMDKVRVAAEGKKETGPVLEPLCRGASETMERLGEAIKDKMLDWTPEDDAVLDEAAEEPLPPLPPEPFVQALRGPAETVLATLAAAINEAPDARSILAIRERCQELLDHFLDAALKVGLKLRIDAAVAGLPAPHPSPSNCTAEEWDTADSFLQGPTRGWVEKYRRMKAEEDDLSGISTAEEEE